MIGDACLALFEDPANALAFARTMGRSYASTRISMHTGIIELVADDVVGRAIFEAAQLSKQAEPGRIVVSRMTADLLSGSGFNFERAFADESDELFLLVDQT
jgi:class 3 adenylate cyclase